MTRAVEKVRERLMRARAALEAAGVPYSVAGGNAVAAWVSRVDEAAVRYTNDVDILIHRADFERVKTAMAAAGFVYRHAKSSDMFLDGADGKVRDAVHIIIANERVHADCFTLAPTVDESEVHETYRILSRGAIVRLLLASFATEDRVLLHDMNAVGLVDAAWLNRLPPELAPRLKELLDNPEG
jgi:hypothetical protein